MAPLLYAFFYGSIYINKTESEVPIAVVDRDKTKLSRQYVSMIDQTENVWVKNHFHSFEKAKEKFLTTEVQGIMIIEEGFESQISRLQSSDVGLLLNTSHFLPSNDINEAITEVSLLLGAGVRLKYFELHGSSEDLSSNLAMPIRVSDHTVYAHPLSYGNFLLPGLLLLILQQTLLIGLAESTAREREQKTFGNWLGEGPRNDWMRKVFGKGLFYFILFSAYALFFHVVNYRVLNLPNHADPFILAVCLSVFFWVLIFFAQWVGSFFSKEIYALQFFAFSTYPIFLLTGYSWPLYAMNPILKMMAWCLPTTPMLEIYNALIFKGATWVEIQGSLLHLVILGGIYWILLQLRFSKIIQSKALKIDPNSL
ncbi:MAG: ABC transporter permease [Schleiferiaceae bacterium]